jgi:hypothetical protein
VGCDGRMESGIPNQERIALAASFEHVDPDCLCLLIGMHDSVLCSPLHQPSDDLLLTNTADMLVLLMEHNDRIPLVP